MNLKSQKDHPVIYGVLYNCMYEITQIHTLRKLVRLYNKMNKEFNVYNCTFVYTLLF
jgi:hypothetical protein